MPAGDITQLLLALRGGRKKAADDLLPLVYDELRRMARDRCGPGASDRTLNATALVHESYLKLFDQTQVGWQDRKHFYSVAAMAMRQIIIDHARKRQALKRGGSMERVNRDVAELGSEDRSEEILFIDIALQRLKQVDDRLAKVVELRFFGGFSVQETAEVLEVDQRTVKRDWRKAKALLYSELGGPQTQ